MEFVSKSDAISATKPEGIDVQYYLFDDYEIHMNVQEPHTTQQWHRHEKIREILFMFEGTLMTRWLDENGDEQAREVHAGDHVDTGREMHTFENVSDKPAKFFALKMMPTGENHRETFKTDKVTRD